MAASGVHAADCTDPDCDRRCIELPLRASKRPVLPDGRDARIALARMTIEHCLREDEQLEEQFQRDFRDAEVVVFHALVPNFEAGIQLSKRVQRALVIGAGFDRVELTSPLRPLQGDEHRVYFRVPVGSP